MNKWIISRSTATDPAMWHVQARTADQLCSFALLVSKRNDTMMRSKTADGKWDVFTMMGDLSHGTMNVVGEIEYVGIWA